MLASFIKIVLPLSLNACEFHKNCVTTVSLLTSTRICGYPPPQTTPQHSAVLTRLETLDRFLTSQNPAGQESWQRSKHWKLLNVCVKPANIHWQIVRLVTVRKHPKVIIAIAHSCVQGTDNECHLWDAFLTSLQLFMSHFDVAASLHLWIRRRMLKMRACDVRCQGAGHR
jgi:hypothetical protein